MVSLYCIKTWIILCAVKSHDPYFEVQDFLFKVVSQKSVLYTLHPTPKPQPLHLGQ